MSLFQAKQYAKYLTSSKGRHGVHSPFVYDFLHKVLDDDKRYYGYEAIEERRRELIADRSEIQVSDFGAGSKSGSSSKKMVRLIAKTALNRPKFCRALNRLVNYHQPKNILELGTSLGISTAYLALAREDCNMISVEGCPNIAKIATESLVGLGLKNVDLRVGKFDDHLEGALEDLGQIDLAFIDGNHRMKPTLQYFQKILPLCHEESVLIFDDIHWSEEMNQAWRKIQSHSQVSLTLDIFEMGIVYFRKGIEKQHFVLGY